MKLDNLENKKIAILATHGFEQSELERPLKEFRDAGATVHVIAPESGNIRGWNEDNWDRNFDVDRQLDDAVAADYDALHLPGGVINPDKLRVNKTALQFVRDFFEAGKPVGAICHGPQILINAEVVDGRKVTSYASIRKDLENAGADWVDEEVVCDQALVTSRHPGDLKAYCKKMSEEIMEGVHTGQHA